MKYKLKYSPDASDKLRELNKQISANYGKPVATKIVSKIMGEIRDLQDKYYLAEVKGVRERTDAIRFTQSEYDKAQEFRNDYYLVVVSNLMTTPRFSCIANPLDNIEFVSKEIRAIQMNYHTTSLDWSRI